MYIGYPNPDMVAIDALKAQKALLLAKINQASILIWYLEKNEAVPKEVFKNMHQLKLSKKTKKTLRKLPA